MVNLLLEAGADPNFAYSSLIEQYNTPYNTPLDCAVYHGNTNIVKALFEKGADINKGKPLYWAALFGTLSGEMLDLLIEYGANVNSKDGKEALNELKYKLKNAKKNPETSNYEINKLVVSISRLEKTNKSSWLKFRSTEIIEQLMDLDPKAPKFNILLEELKNELSKWNNYLREGRIKKLLDIINDKIKSNNFLESSRASDAAKKIIDFLNKAEVQAKGLKLSSEEKAPQKLMRYKIKHLKPSVGDREEKYEMEEAPSLFSKMGEKIKNFWQSKKSEQPERKFDPVR